MYFAKTLDLVKIVSALFSYNNSRYEMAQSANRFKTSLKTELEALVIF